MIGIIMETRGWIWLVLYLVVFLEWFVYDIYPISFVFLCSNFLISEFLAIETCDAAIQKANERCQGICTEGLF